MKVRYTGPDQAGQDIAIEGGVIHAPHGKPVDVPGDIAASLIERDGWERAKSRETTSQSSAAVDDQEG